MWDRLLVDCNIATLEERPGNPLGIVEHGAIGIAEGKIVRVGKRTEMAGFRARASRRVRRRWVTPGLIDCHTHLVFGGTRADEHAMRRAGASYEEIAKAGGGIASTVKRTAAASDERIAGAVSAPIAHADAGRLHDGGGEVGYGTRREKRAGAA